MRKVLLAALLAPLCEAARSTWSAEMAEGKDTACFEKPAPASAAAAAGADAEPAGACAGRVCVEKLKRASAARHAGHFCGNRWCAAVPQAAACVGGCPIELPRYDKNMPNLLPIELLQPMPYGEAWVYGCARKDGAGEPDSCGGGERARDVHSALEELRYLDEHAKGKSGAVSCACNQRLKQSKKDDDRHMVIVLTDIGWEMAVAAEWGGLGLPRLTAAREELFDAAPYLVARGGGLGAVDIADAQQCAGGLGAAEGAAGGADGAARAERERRAAAHRDRGLGRAAHVDLFARSARRRRQRRRAENTPASVDVSGPPFSSRPASAGGLHRYPAEQISIPPEGRTRPERTAGSTEGRRPLLRLNRCTHLACCAATFHISRCSLVGSEDLRISLRA